MNQFEFTDLVMKTILDKIYSYAENLPDGGFNTKLEHSKRKTHFYTFVNTVCNKAIGKVLTEFGVANYKIDDSREVTDSIELLQSERNRLIKDIQECENIILFLVNNFYFTS